MTTSAVLQAQRRSTSALVAQYLRELADLVRDTAASVLPDAARAMLVLLLEQIREAQARIAHGLHPWEWRVR